MEEHVSPPPPPLPPKKEAVECLLGNAGRVSFKVCGEARHFPTPQGFGIWTFLLSTVVSFSHKTDVLSSSVQSHLFSW